MGLWGYRNLNCQQIALLKLISTCIYVWRFQLIYIIFGMAKEDDKEPYALMLSLINACAVLFYKFISSFA